MPWGFARNTKWKGVEENTVKRYVGLDWPCENLWHLIGDWDACSGRASRKEEMLLERAQERTEAC